MSTFVYYLIASQLCVGQLFLQVLNRRRRLVGRRFDQSLQQPLGRMPLYYAAAAGRRSVVVVVQRHFERFGGRWMNGRTEDVQH